MTKSKEIYVNVANQKSVNICTMDKKTQYFNVANLKLAESRSEPNNILI